MLKIVKILLLIVLLAVILVRGFYGIVMLQAQPFLNPVVNDQQSSV